MSNETWSKIDDDWINAVNITVSIVELENLYGILISWHAIVVGIKISFSKKVRFGYQNIDRLKIIHCMKHMKLDIVGMKNAF